MKTTRLLIIVATILSACSEEPKPDVGFDYLHETFIVMKLNALYRKTIDWDKLEADAHAKVVDGKTIEGVFPAIEFALRSLGDNHSTYYAKNSTVISGNPNPCDGASTTPGPIADIGYIKVDRTTSNTADHAAYATDIQAKIENQDRDDIKGWIVDLRGNTGGFLGPMIAGIGPIFGNGVVGYFIDADENASAYLYSYGTATVAGAGTAYVTDFYNLIHTPRKIAVLIDHRTASSAEGIAIALLAFPNAKSFGVASCGQSTSVSGFDLSDGATLAIANAYLADRNKKKNGGSVIPDITVSGDQEVVDKAVEWINEP